MMSMITPSTYHNAQLTSYNFQSRMENIDRIRSMIQHATMDNSPTMISKVGWRVEMGS